MEHLYTIAIMLVGLLSPHFIGKKLKLCKFMGGEFEIVLNWLLGAFVLALLSLVGAIYFGLYNWIC